MKVLLSIKPEFTLKIFDGSKKYEFRRVIFKRPDIETIVVYASDPIKQVVGEFDIGDILHEEPEQLWEQTYCHAGITKAMFMDYFENQEKGYAIEVKVTRKYRTPLSLNDLTLSAPPQSFMYLNTDPLDRLCDPVNSSLSSPMFFSVLASG